MGILIKVGLAAVLLGLFLGKLEELGFIKMSIRHSKTAGIHVTNGFTDSRRVTQFDDPSPARDAGMKIGDKILVAGEKTVLLADDQRWRKANGSHYQSLDEIFTVLDGPRSPSIGFERDGKEYVVTLQRLR